MSLKLESFSLCNFLIQVIDKSFGFDTAVEEAQRAINAAHVEAESVENGIGVVKLMGRYSGKFCITGLCSIMQVPTSLRAILSVSGYYQGIKRCLYKFNAIDVLTCLMLMVLAFKI